MPMQVRGVSELVFTLGELPKEIRAALKPAVLDAGNIVADQVKANASFSSWIPGAVTVSAGFGINTAGAKIRVAERGFPHAGEVRSKEGNGLDVKPLRHPVYGDREVWTDKNSVTHPFAHPALEQKRDEATAVIAEAVATVIASSGLGG